MNGALSVGKHRHYRRTQIALDNGGCHLNQCQVGLLRNLPYADQRLLAVNREALREHSLRLFERVARLDGQVNAADHDLQIHVRVDLEQGQRGGIREGLRYHEAARRQLFVCKEIQRTDGDIARTQWQRVHSGEVVGSGEGREAWPLALGAQLGVGDRVPRHGALEARPLLILHLEEVEQMG